MPTYIFYLLAFLAMAPATRSQQWYQTGNPHFLTTGDIFDTIKDTKSIKIIKFFSPWCKYCRYIKAYMDNYKASHQMSPNLKFYQFNCQAQGAMFCGQHFQVYAYPAVIMVNQKGQTINRISGLYPEDVINNICEQLNQKAKQLNKTLSKEESKQEIKEQSKNQNQIQKYTQNQNSKKQQHLTQSKASNEGKQNPSQKSQQRSNEPEKLIKVDNKKTIGRQNEKKQENGKFQTKINEKSSDQDIKKQKTPRYEQQKSKGINARDGQKQKTTNQMKHEEQIKSSIAQAGNKQKQRNSVPEIKKQMFEEKSLQNTNKPDPSNPNQQLEIKVEQPKNNQSHIIKYLLYLVGGGVLAFYAYKIYTNKHDSTHQSSSSKTQVNFNQKSNPKPVAKQRRIGNRDIENQMLVQQVMDENL